MCPTSGCSCSSLLPFFIVLKISFRQSRRGHSAVHGNLSWAGQPAVDPAQPGQLHVHLLGEDELYISAYLGSLKMAFISTLLCLLLGYPMAYAIARASKEAQTVLLLLIMMPTWTAILIRVYARMGILSNNGLLNGQFLGLG